MAPRATYQMLSSHVELGGVAGGVVAPTERADSVGVGVKPDGACIGRVGRARGRVGTALALAVMVALTTLAAGCGGSQRPTRATGPSSGSPSWSPDGSRIAFISDGQLSVISPDGSKRLRLTRVSDFAWSPDGGRIAFYLDDQIYVMRADGSGKRRLVLNAWPATPTWSPDGREITFQAKADIYVVSVDGTGTRRLTHSRSARVGYSDPAWSPDGRKIALNRTTAVGRWWNDVWEIDVIDTDVSQLR